MLLKGAGGYLNWSIYLSLSFVGQCLILQKQNKNSFSITAIYSFEVNKPSLLISCFHISYSGFICIVFISIKKRKRNLLLLIKKKVSFI